MICVFCHIINIYIDISKKNLTLYRELEQIRYTCGSEVLNSADDSVSLRSAYDLLRPHSVFDKFKTLNFIVMLDNADLMQDSWMFLILLVKDSCALLEMQFIYGV